MKGSHPVLQVQCPVCSYPFMLNDIIVMRVIELGANVNSPDGPAIGVFVEYLHDFCAPASQA